jgi:hypothetical protein
MKASKNDPSWFQRQCIDAIESAEKMISYFRTCADQIAEVTNKDHPAVIAVIQERKKMVAFISDLRESFQKESDEAKFLYDFNEKFNQVKKVMETSQKEEDFVGGTISLDGYYGQSYKFTGMGWGYRNCDVYRVAINELKKLEEELNNKREGHESLIKEVVELSQKAREGQKKVCVKWALKFAADDEPDRAQQYRDSLEEVLGNVSELGDIDKAIEASKQKVKAAREAEAAAAEARSKAAAVEMARYKAEMQTAWMSPYTGGSIFCENETWFYQPNGRATLQNSEVYYIFDGLYLSGSMYGEAKWNGTNLTWRYNHRDLYSFSFNGGVFVSQNHVVNNDWKWDGNLLQATNDDWKARLVRFDGKVPVPVLLVIAMRKWTARRSEEVSGNFLCRSALWNEGVIGKTCDKCSSNFGIRCAVCKDKISFPQTPAQMCKYCASAIQSCIKCGGSSAYTPAFLCDTCKYNFNGNCVRTKSHY